MLGTKVQQEAHISSNVIPGILDNRKDFTCDASKSYGDKYMSLAKILPFLCNVCCRS